MLNASSSRRSTSSITLLLRADFGKDIAHRSREHIDELVEERLVEAERAAVADRAAQDAAQDVVAAFVAGLDAVGDGEAQRADVVGDDAEGDVDLFLFGCRADLAAASACGERAEPYFFPLSFSSSSKIGRKMSVS